MKLTLNICRLLKTKETRKFLSFNTTLILLLTTFLLAGCGSLFQSGSIDSLPKNTPRIVDSNLEKNRRLWQESKIVDYNFVSTKFGGGTYAWVPVSIQVKNSQVISMEPVKERQLQRIDGYEDFDTVEKSFNKIQEAYDKGYGVKVTYNKEYGYPETFSIDDVKDPDSAFSIEISKFEIVKAN